MSIRVEDGVVDKLSGHDSWLADRLLTRAQVELRTGLSRSSIYRAMREGTFPEPIKVTPRAVRWSQNELEEWLASLPRATGDH